MRPITVIEHFETAADWTVLGNDTDNIAASTAPWYGTNCIEFDKVDGTDNTTIAAVYRVLTGRNIIDMSSRIRPSDYVCWEANMKAGTNVTFTFVRLGNSATNYLEWQVPAASLVASTWTRCAVRAGNCIVAGTGLDWSALSYICVGYIFAAAGNALANIDIDHLHIQPAVLA
jgi:hypothetical protein